ncbi:MAG: ATP-dependent zinc metalloprotease FtsH [Victivallaceae bacterium]|nr:ATP-dependent zinc metalloprotease FtsH [Victivallaceae bacterium]
MAEPNHPSTGQGPRRSSRAAFVWLAVFIVIGIMALMRMPAENKTAELTQSEFENALAAGKIATAKIVPENDRVLSISGVFRSTEPVMATGAVVKNDAKAGSYKVRVLFSNELDSLLRGKANVTVENDTSGWWWNLLGAMLPFLLIIGAIYFISARQMRASGRGAMDFGRSRARMIPADELNIHFDDIAGADEAKEEIKEIVDFLKDPLKFQLVGGHIPKGCLLVGSPGTGKTLMAKAVACEAGVPFFSISGSDFVEMFVGVGASRVRDMFDEARKHVPCLIFIDEIDAVGRSRFSGLGGGHDEREQTLNAMLVEMDGLESRSGVIVLAATNRPDVLDPALLRPGRFDRQIVMDLPDIAGRRKILDVHIKKIKTEKNISLDVIARTTPGFSGADLANLCNEAALLAARFDREAVTQQDLEEARDKVSYGRERRSRKISDHERKLTAYHEAGHALVALHCKYATPVHKVTIIPRGQSYLGATFTMPKEDVYTRSYLELLDEMAMTTGGRAAESLTMGDITTGASADIEHLTHLARLMVCAYGMSDKIGLVHYGDFGPLRVRADAPQPESLSPETAREIDLEIRRFSEEAFNRAKELLIEHRDELEKLAAALLEKETLDIAEINVLLGRTPEPVAEPVEASREISPDAEIASAAETDASADAGQEKPDGI